MTGDASEQAEQLALVPEATARRKQASTAKLALKAASRLPVARIAVDTGLTHLDRPFDYLVPTTLDELVVVGCRVKVRFAGRLVDGFVTDRIDESEHGGKLAFIAKVISPEPVLHPEIINLVRAVADRYAGTFGDVLRLAIPPRHARAEEASREIASSELPQVDDKVWQSHTHGPEFLASLGSRSSPRAVWGALPGQDPAVAVAQAVLATLHSGRGAVVCVPDVRDAARWNAAFIAVLGAGHHVVLTAASTPAARYAAFLAASRGEVKVVLGTRAAAFAPVRDLGLVAMWDDGDDLYAEPRAPYPHAREVMLLRATASKSAVLIGGHARTAEGQSLVESGWCTELVADQAARRTAWPRLDVTDGSTAGSAPARLPHEVFRAVRAAKGAVLMQVPRRGYRESLSCQSCRHPARCRVCQGPLVQTSASAPIVCRWCATAVASWSCSQCGGTTLRAPVVGQLRTAEEFGQAFPDLIVLTSGGETVLDEVEPGRVLVLATPGAEPHVAGGYDVVVLLDTWLMRGRDDVRVEEEAHRRWFNALALAGRGAAAIAVGDALMLQALVRADPAGSAARELASRAETHLPPTARLVAVDADDELLEQLAARLWTEHTEVLGPVPVDPRDESAGSRLILRSPRREGTQLAAELKAVAADRSAAKQSALRIQVDPQAF